MARGFDMGVGGWLGWDAAQGFDMGVLGWLGGGDEAQGFDMGVRGPGGDTAQPLIRPTVKSALLNSRLLFDICSKGGSLRSQRLRNKGSCALHPAEQ